MRLAEATEGLTQICTHKNIARNMRHFHLIIPTLQVGKILFYLILLLTVPDDYKIVARSLTFNADGNAVHQIRVRISPDNVVENEETLILSLTSTDSAVIAQPASSTVHITDQTSERMHEHVYIFSWP